QVVENSIADRFAKSVQGDCANPAWCARPKAYLWRYFFDGSGFNAGHGYQRTSLSNFTHRQPSPKSLCFQKNLCRLESSIGLNDASSHPSLDLLHLTIGRCVIRIVFYFLPVLIEGFLESTSFFKHGSQCVVHSTLARTQADPLSQYLF